MSLNACVFSVLLFCCLNDFFFIMQHLSSETFNLFKRNRDSASCEGNRWRNNRRHLLLPEAPLIVLWTARSWLEILICRRFCALELKFCYILSQIEDGFPMSHKTLIHFWGLEKPNDWIRTSSSSSISRPQACIFSYNKTILVITRFSETNWPRITQT